MMSGKSLFSPVAPISPVTPTFFVSLNRELFWSLPEQRHGFLEAKKPTSSNYNLSCGEIGASFPALEKALLTLPGVKKRTGLFFTFHENQLNEVKNILLHPGMVSNPDAVKAAFDAAIAEKSSSPTHTL